jgi:hypothetical protein
MHLCNCLVYTTSLADLGDGEPAAEGSFSSFELDDMTVDASGNLFLADARARRVRRVDATTGIMTTVARDHVPGDTSCTTQSAGEGGPATAADVPGPVAVAVDPHGSVFFGQGHVGIDPDPV